MIQTFVIRVKANLKLLFYIGLAMFFCFESHSALAEQRGEYEVKAAFILNFILLTDWPEDIDRSDGDDIVMCVVGFKSLPHSFKSLTGKKVRDRFLRVVVGDAGTTLPQCQVIFYRDGTGTGNLVRSLSAVRSQPVLTIGDSSKVTQLGGAIHFYKDKDRLRFAINPKVVSNQGLKMSSRLLQIATLIDD